ncbi:MAG: endonuclease/exonuclease/phosphatase family protein [Pseudomonadota bacterium]
MRLRKGGGRATGRKVRVTSYNIRKAVGLDWRRDPERILDVLAEIDADIVVLQEADRRYGSRAGVLPLDRLERDLGLALADVSIRSDSHGWHGNMVLTKSPIQMAERIALPHIDPRGAIRVVLEAHGLEVIGTHLGLTPGTRRRQMAQLMSGCREVAHPTIIAGDFNEWNDAKFELSSDLTLVTPGPSYHASRPVGALDRFIVNAGIRVVQTNVHRSELAQRASDHLPVVMDFEIVGAT